MLATQMLRRCVRPYATSTRVWAPTGTLMRNQGYAPPLARSVITIKKFYREKEPSASRKPLAAVAASEQSTPASDASDPSTLKPLRLAKRIALAGVCSRREAEKLIQAHEVTVNGKLVTDLATNVDVERDAVLVKGKPLAKTLRRKVWMANKLAGELVTANDPENRPTIFDRLRVMGLKQHMMPVGRLDFNTEGLLLFTNDGEYARELEHPKSEIVRVYKVLVRGSVTPSKLDELRRGPIVDGIKYRSIHAFVQSTNKKDSWLQVKLAEGKNREVRKALAHVRLVVKRLIRVQYGPYRLADLPNGAVLEVRPKSLTFDKDNKKRSSPRKATRATKQEEGVNDKIEEDDDE